MQTEITDQPSQGNINAIIAGLKRSPSPVERQAQDLGIFIKDEGEIIAGLFGQSYWDWLYVKYLWVSEDHQRQGLGRQLMGIAEEEAIRRGCIGIHLNTYSFQAVDFYRKLGYAIFGEIRDYPRGEMRYYLLKQLNPDIISP
jgi:ribosomal protein S18 acetylase RimI-like enzyme